jgi:hypothetical protein
MSKKIFTEIWQQRRDWTISKLVLPARNNGTCRSATHEQQTCADPRVHQLMHPCADQTQARSARTQYTHATRHITRQPTPQSNNNNNDHTRRITPDEISKLLEYENDWQLSYNKLVFARALHLLLPILSRRYSGYKVLVAVAPRA